MKTDGELRDLKMRIYAKLLEENPAIARLVSEHPFSCAMLFGAAWDTAIGIARRESLTADIVREGGA